MIFFLYLDFFSFKKKYLYIFFKLKDPIPTNISDEFF